MTVSILIVVPLLALVKPLVATQSLDCQLIKVQISDLDMRSYNQKRLKWFALICFDIFFFFWPVLQVQVCVFSSHERPLQHTAYRYLKNKFWWRLQPPKLIKGNLVKWVKYGKQVCKLLPYSGVSKDSEKHGEMPHRAYRMFNLKRL